MIFQNLHLVAILAALADAAEFRRLDGVHRVEKRAPEVTPAPVLHERDDAVCGTSLKLCPSSLDGGCCPDDYECARESCFATTRAPSTCNGRASWYPCDIVYGGGCCPDNYICQTADQCVPPAGVSFTYDCPTSQYLCPSSLGYGCCSNHMGCGMNQCYSTEPTTETSTSVITTTRNGRTRTITTTAVVIETPTAPTARPTDLEDAPMVKLFPTVVAKITPTASPDSDRSSSSSDSELSTGALIGIVAGACAILIIAIIAAWVFIRRLNALAAADVRPVEKPSAARPPMRQYKPTDSEVDALSVDPLMMPPSRSALAARRARSTSNSSSTRKASSPFTWPQSPDLPSPDLDAQTPTSFGGRFTIVSPSSRHGSFDESPRVPMSATQRFTGYFDQLYARATRKKLEQRNSAQSTAELMGSSVTDSTEPTLHGRHWSNASSAELEGSPYVPELMGSPTGSSMFPSPTERRTSQGSIQGVMARPPLAKGGGGGNGSRAQPPLGSVSEEAMYGEGGRWR